MNPPRAANRASVLLQQAVQRKGKDMGNKRIARPLLAGVVIAGALLVSACSPIVIIPDKALESAVRAEIRKPLSLFLTVKDLEQVRTLDAAGLGISRLDGLEYCSSLTELFLNDNQIREITALRRMDKLVKLDLGGNSLRNIEAIAGLLNLEYLDLSGEENIIKDWAPLEANVRNGGLGAGNTVVLPGIHVFDEDGEPLTGFEGAYVALQEKKVVIQYR